MDFEYDEDLEEKGFEVADILHEYDPECDGDFRRFTQNCINTVNAKYSCME